MVEEKNKKMKNIDKLKSILIKRFTEKIEAMTEEELNSFLCFLDSNDIIELPDSVYSCNMCKQLYGDCGDLMDEFKGNELEVCHKRFHDYCEKEALEESSDTQTGDE